MFSVSFRYDLSRFLYKPNLSIVFVQAKSVYELCLYLGLSYIF